VGGGNTRATGAQAGGEFFGGGGVESLMALWRVITPHIVAQSGRAFIGCVESYHCAQCGTVC